MPKSFNDIPAVFQLLIFVVISAALAGGVFYLYVLPLNDKRDSLEKEVAKLKAENDKNDAFRQQQTEYLNRIKQLEAQLVTLQTIVPDEQATDQFMKTVFAAGTGAGVSVRTFIPKPPQTKDYYVEMPFTLRLDGTYYSLLNFFDRLAHEQRIMSVSGLSLGDPKGGGMGNYEVHPTETVGANCILTTYYNKPLAPAAVAPPKKKP